MKLVTFVFEGSEQPGLLDAGQVLPLKLAGFDSVLSLIADGQQSLDRVGALIVDSSASRLELGSVKLLAPLTNPPRIFGIGLNYRDHATESRMAVQSVPTFFLKLPSSIVGPDGTVPLPPEATQLTMKPNLLSSSARQAAGLRPRIGESTYSDIPASTM